MSKSVEERFWEKVDKSAGPDGCWLWLAFCNSGGFGAFWHTGNMRPARRVAWQLTHGAIPKGSQVLHLGNNPSCVNPTHLVLEATYESPGERFWAKVDKSAGPNGCWLWTAFCNPSGYGRFSYTGGEEVTHRVAWILTNGAIPEGLLVCHHCDVPRCVNPLHLFLGTNADNTRDAISKDRLARGEAQGNSKLTAADVLAIRVQYARGGVSQAPLGKAFGITQAQVSNIVNHKHWKHLS